MRYEEIEEEITQIEERLLRLSFESPEIEPLARRMNILKARLYASELGHRISKSDANRHLKSNKLKFES